MNEYPTLKLKLMQFVVKRRQHEQREDLNSTSARATDKAQPLPSQKLQAATTLRAISFESPSDVRTRKMSFSNGVSSPELSTLIQRFEQKCTRHTQSRTMSVPQMSTVIEAQTDGKMRAMSRNSYSFADRPSARLQVSDMRGDSDDDDAERIVSAIHGIDWRVQRLQGDLHRQGENIEAMQTLLKEVIKRLNAQQNSTRPNRGTT